MGSRALLWACGLWKDTAFLQNGGGSKSELEPRTFVFMEICRKR